MHIAYFTDSYFPQINGVSVSVKNFAKELRKKGHIVTIFAPELKESVEEEGVIRLKSLKLLSSEPEVRMPIPLLNTEYQQMFSIPIDIIHAHGNGAFSLLGYQVARMRNIPFVMTFHAIHSKYTHYVLNGKLITPGMIIAGMRWFGNACDGIVAPSEKMRRELIKYHITKPIHVIPNFIDRKTFTQTKQSFLRKKLSLSPDEPVLLSVGRLGLEKNFEFILKTVKRLLVHRPNAHLVIVGKGKEKDSLEAMASKLGISNNIHIIGEVDQNDMPNIYADSDVFVFASVTETQGIVVLEAAVSGKPIVVVNDPAFTTIVKDGVNGYCVPLSQKAFVNALNKILSDKNLAAVFGKASREIAQKKFEGTMLTNNMLDFYMNVIKTSVHPRPPYKQVINKTTITKVVKFIEGVNHLFEGK